MASRPVAIRMRPIRGRLWRASKVYQRPPSQTWNQALKSIGSGTRRHADITEVAGAVARRDIHAATKGDREVGEVAADAGAVEEAAIGRSQRVSVLIVEGDVIVHEVDDRLYPAPPGDDIPELRPGKVREAVGIAVAAA